VFIPDVILTEGQWVYIAGVVLATLVGVALHRETAMGLSVIGFTVGLSPAALAVAPYLAMLTVLSSHFLKWAAPRG